MRANMTIDIEACHRAMRNVLLDPNIRVLSLKSIAAEYKGYSVDNKTMLATFKFEPNDPRPFWFDSKKEPIYNTGYIHPVEQPKATEFEGYLAINRERLLASLEEFSHMGLVIPGWFIEHIAKQPTL